MESEFYPDGTYTELGQPRMYKVMVLIDAEAYEPIALTHALTDHLGLSLEDVKDIELRAQYDGSAACLISTKDVAETICYEVNSCIALDSYSITFEAVPI